jgi:hypothetical protein
MSDGKSSISNAKSYAEMGEFWDTHDLSDFWDQTEPVVFEVDLQSDATYYQTPLTMPNLRNFIRLETQLGEPLTVGATTITPQSQALIVRLPFLGFVWNHPIGVIVERGGQTHRRPIVDVTRYAMGALAGSTLLFSVIITLVAARRRSISHE